MSRHEHFEELCSLAVLGEVSPEELTELEKHLRECPECRVAYADFVALTGEHLPAADRSSGPISLLVGRRPSKISGASDGCE